MAKIISNDFLEMREEMKSQYARFKSAPTTVNKNNVELAINLSNGLCKSHITEILKEKYDRARYVNETTLRSIEPSKSNTSLLDEIVSPGNKKQLSK